MALDTRPIGADPDSVVAAVLDVAKRVRTRAPVAAK